VKYLALVSILVGALSLTPGAQAPHPVVSAASKAMGVAALQSIQYSGTGSAFSIGQAASPGGPWPRFELAKYVARVDYAALAMREETVRRDVERPPRGGGAGPFNPSTGQGGMRPIPGDVVQTLVSSPSNEAGLIQVWMTPHGFLKAASTKNVQVMPVRVDGRALQAVSFAVGARTLTAYIDDRNLVERIATITPNPLLGDMPIEAVFSDYKDYSGVKFPTRIVQRQGGHPTLDVAVSDVFPNAGLVEVGIPTPRGPETVKTGFERIADGVWFLTGGAPLSVLVEFGDHVVVIEAPQNEARSEATIAAVKGAMPAKPIRYVVNTHHHFDHSGGLRGYVTAGIPVITHALNARYFAQILGAKAAIETVREKRVLDDAANTLELHHLRGNLHAETLLVAYLPKQRLLVQADAFHPRPGAAPLASPPPFTVNLVENIRRLKLDVERVVHVHGGTDSLATVAKAAGL
jgi:glyoxylase-like metal-dependent hydrolase (beta-lactamase superfamily II)